MIRILLRKLVIQSYITKSKMWKEKKEQMKNKKWGGGGNLTFFSQWHWLKIDLTYFGIQEILRSLIASSNCCFIWKFAQNVEKSELNEGKCNTWSSRGSYVLLLSVRINSWDWWGQLQAVSILFPFYLLRTTYHLSPEGVGGASLLGGRGGGSYSPLKDFKWGTVENWLLMRGDHRNTTEPYGGIR